MPTLTAEVKRYINMIKLLKTISMITLLITALSVLGGAINSFFAWDWLTSFFGIIRSYASVFDFMFDTTTLWILVGYSFLIEASIWLLRGTILIIRYFK